MLMTTTMIDTKVMTTTTKIIKNRRVIDDCSITETSFVLLWFL